MAIWLSGPRSAGAHGAFRGRFSLEQEGEVELRTLGATKAQVNRILFAEYLALGTLGAAVALRRPLTSRPSRATRSPSE